METKICGKCKKTKEITEFYIKRLVTKIISQPWCKLCCSDRHREYYLSNKQYFANKAHQFSSDNTAFVNSLKDRPCADCGIKYKPHVMQFDHLRDKEFNISYGAHGGASKVKILEEVKKCDLVCANCHAERTYSRFPARKPKCPPRKAPRPLRHKIVHRKLTPEQVVDITCKLKHSTNRAIATDYGIDHKRISEIRLGRAYREFTGFDLVPKHRRGDII